MTCHVLTMLTSDIIYNGRTDWFNPYRMPWNSSQVMKTEQFIFSFNWFLRHFRIVRSCDYLIFVVTYYNF